MVRPPREFVALVTGAARVHGTRLPLPCLNVIVMVLAPCPGPRRCAGNRDGGAGGRGRDTFSWWCEEVDAWPTCCASRSAPVQFAANIRERVGAQPSGLTDGA